MNSLDAILCQICAILNDSWSVIRSVESIRMKPVILRGEPIADPLTPSLEGAAKGLLGGVNDVHFLLQIEILQFLREHEIILAVERNGVLFAQMGAVGPCVASLDGRVQGNSPLALANGLLVELVVRGP